MNIQDLLSVLTIEIGLLLIAMLTGIVFLYRGRAKTVVNSDNLALAALKDSQDYLRTALGSLQEEVRSLRKQVENSTERYINLQDQYLQISVAYEKMKAENQRLTLIIQQQTGQIKRLTQAQQAAQVLIDKLRSELFQLRDEKHETA